MNDKVFSVLFSLLIITLSKVVFIAGSGLTPENEKLRRLTWLSSGKETSAPTEAKVGSIASRTSSVVVKRPTKKYAEEMGLPFVEPKTAAPKTLPPKPTKSPSNSASKSTSTSTSTPIAETGEINSISASTPTATANFTSISSAKTIGINSTSSSTTMVTANKTLATVNKTVVSSDFSPTPVSVQSIFPTMAVVKSIASKTNKAKSATKEPLSAKMTFEKAETAPPLTMSNSSYSNTTRFYMYMSNSSNSNKTIFFPHGDIEEVDGEINVTKSVPNCDGENEVDDCRNTTKSFANGTSEDEGNVNSTSSMDDDETTEVIDDHFSTSDGDFFSDDFIFVPPSTKSPLVFPKEKEQPKVWPLVLGCIFTFTAFLSFGATALKNYGKRKGYEMIPKTLDV